MTSRRKKREDAARFEAFAEAFVYDEDEPPSMIIKWYQWPRWFRDNVGIGNNLDMWWPSRKGEHSVWVLCDRCGLPFEIPTGLVAAGMAPEGARSVLEEVEWTGGPCTHCKAEGVIATGTPILTTKVDSSGRAVVGANPAIVQKGYEAWEGLTRGLVTGLVTVDEAAAMLRTGDSYMQRVGKWMESRPVTTTAASAILAAIIGLVGQQALSAPDDHDDEIVQIIDRVLDHYDEAHSDESPARERRPGRERDRGRPGRSPE